MPLNMGNITDDETERLLVLVQEIANMSIYGEDIPFPGEGQTDEHDAVDALNDLIASARNLLARKHDAHLEARMLGDATGEHGATD